MPIRPPVPSVADLAREFGLDLRAGGDGAAPVTGATHDSRRVRPGDLYAALPGERVHGSRFVADAVAAGAVAVLTDEAGAVACGPPPVPLLVAADARAVLGPVAAAVHGRPGDDLAVVGVTGTNGKTTVTWLLHHLLRSTGVGAGLIGTVAVRVHDDQAPSSMTTPEATDLQATLAAMRDAGAAVVALEVSSHALALHRVDGTHMSVVGFTNLSRDHLDFHGDMESYLAAKMRLFTGGFADRAVVCTDDDAGRRVADTAGAAGMDVWTLSTVGVPADVVLRGADTGVDGRQRVVAAGPFGPGGRPDELVLDVPMPGRHNAANTVTALALALRTAEASAGHLERVPDGYPDALARAVSAFPGVPGRMERVVDPGSAGRTPLVVVDYAHTPDAVATAVESLRAATPGRLVVVLGAGGARDQGKRGPMGAAAAAAADVVVVTDDNPRGEDPAAIRSAVLAGAVSAPHRRAGDVVECADRAAAIARALACCGGPEDTVLVTGKGHETGQDYGDGRREPFDDRDAAARALHAWAVEAGVREAVVDRDEASSAVGTAPATMQGTGVG